MYLDRLSAIASEARVRGATNATHHLGALHTDIHHVDYYTAPANSPDSTWKHFLTTHRTA